MTSLYNENGIRQLVDERVALIAGRQHGVFTRGQAIRCDASDGCIRWRLDVGRWERLYPKIYRLAGTPRTWQQRALAASLYMGPDAPVSHRAAAAMRRLAGRKQAEVELTVPRNRKRKRLNQIIIHWLEEPIPPDDITTMDGIPVTTPARTLLDLLTVEPESVVERALDDAVRRRLVTLRFLDSWLQDPRRKRHRGWRAMRGLVDARLDAGITESHLEDDVLRMLRAARLPDPQLQYILRDGDRFIARLDFAYPEQRVAIEADGFRYHGDRQAFDEDRARANAVQSMGWLVLRVTAKHLEQDREAVAAWVRRALSR